MTVICQQKERPRGSGKTTGARVVSLGRWILTLVMGLWVKGPSNALPWPR